MGAPWLDRVTGSPTWPDDAGQLTSAVESARSTLGRLTGPRGVRDRTGRVAAAATIRAARASAALAGVPLALDLATASISDPVLAGAVRVAAALGELAATWRRAPAQALARLHMLAAADLVGPEELGRPRIDDDAPDLVSGRLAALTDLLTRAHWPAPVLVAIVHAELFTLAPFGSADGVVARAAARLTMITTGLEPSGVALPEVAHLRSAGAYRSGLQGYAEGGAAEVDAWIVQECQALALGAAEGSALAAASG